MHPIVSAYGTATYNTTKFIINILQNYCGKTSSFVKDNTDFTNKFKNLSINPEEEALVLFYVSALFTSIPVPVALQAINSNISSWINITNFCKIPTEKFIKLLEFTMSNASSASIRNCINTYRVKPWINLSPLSLVISIWNILNP